MKGKPKNEAVALSSTTELMNKDFPLGINGYTYVDLHQPLRLRDLHKTFEDSVRQHDHVDPHTGEEYFVYSCYNQDQGLDRVDFPNLNARLRQNTVQEKLSNLWLDYLLDSQT